MPTDRFGPHAELSDLFLRFLPLRRFLPFLDPYLPAERPINRFLRFLPLRGILRFLDPLPSGTDADRPISSISSLCVVFFDFWTPYPSTDADRQISSPLRGILQFLDPLPSGTSINADRPISSISSFA